MTEVRRSLEVRVSAERAFGVWTGRIAEWWPAGHRPSGDAQSRVMLEEGPGGRLYERTPQGEERDIGRVVAWEPAVRLELDWFLGGVQSRVEVRFVPLEKDKTRVEVIHTGPLQMAPRFERGWEALLAGFRDACG